MYTQENGRTRTEKVLRHSVCEDWTSLADFTMSLLSHARSFWFDRNFYRKGVNCLDLSWSHRSSWTKPSWKKCTKDYFCKDYFTRKFFYTSCPTFKHYSMEYNLQNMTQITILFILSLSNHVFQSYFKMWRKVITLIISPIVTFYQKDRKSSVINKKSNQKRNERREENTRFFQPQLTKESKKQILRQTLSWM